MTASVDWLHRNPILNLPITIGTYPLLDEPVPQVPKTMETLPTITLTNGNAGQQLTDSASPSAPLLNPSTYPSAPIQFPFDGKLKNYIFVHQIVNLKINHYRATKL